MQFSDLGLPQTLITALEAEGYTTPTPVQVQAIPRAIAGVDLLVSSHTGSGKTAAFLLPTLTRISNSTQQNERRSQGAAPRVLVLAPTRELAQQVQKAAETYGRRVRGFRVAALVGGTSFGLQVRRLQQGVDLIVATPGRLMDHMERGRVDLSQLEVLILDEADRMLDMGFIDDIRAIVSRTPESRQTLLYSATLDGVVGALALQLTRNPERVEIAAVPSHESKIEERLHFADDLGHKTRLLDAVLKEADEGQAVVFTATKLSAESLSDELREKGYSAEALHGDMHQNQRNRTLKRLRDGHTRILVATDVAARGIDVAGISHVVNFDLPRQAEDYVHRIGRTGRAGRSGVAVSLAGHRDKRLVQAIERYTGKRIAVSQIAGLEPTARPERGFGGKPGGGRGGKPFGDRGGFGDRKPYGDRGGFGGGSRSGSSFGGQRDGRTGGGFGGGAAAAPRGDSFGNREPNGNRERTSQDAQPRGFGHQGAGFGQDRQGDNRGRQAFGDRKPFGDRAQGHGFGGGDRKPYGDRSASAPRSGERSHSGERRQHFGRPPRDF